MPAGEGGQPPTVTPNGDGVTDAITIPFAVSEPATVTATIAGPGGTTVRTLTLPATGHGTVTWDGRAASGKALPDGRYTISLSGRDAAGNVGAAVPVVVDVYAALADVVRAPALFYPQDGDALARTATVTLRLRARAKLTIQVVDAAGAVVRTAFADRSTPKGDVSWSWNGKVRGGAYAAPGAYRIVVTATNGQQRVSQSSSVRADAFRLAASTVDATRGKPLTVTAVSAEPLATAPVIVIREPGVPAWTVAMTKAAGATWTATVHAEARGGRRNPVADGQGARRRGRPERQHPAPGAPLARACQRGDNQGVNLLPAWRSPEVPEHDDANGPRARLATAMAGLPPVARERRRIARSFEHGDHPPRGQPVERQSRRLSSAVRAMRPDRQTERGRNCARPRNERPSSSEMAAFVILETVDSGGRCTSPSRPTSVPRPRTRPPTSRRCTPPTAPPGTRPPSATKAGSTRPSR